MTDLFTDLSMNQRLFALAAVIMSFGFGYFYRWHRDDRTVGAAQKRRDQILEQAEREAELKKREAILAAKDEQQKQRQNVERELDSRRVKQKRTEERLNQREQELNRRSSELKKKEQDAESQLQDFERQRQALALQADELKKMLEKSANVTAEEAKAELISLIEDEANAEAARTVRTIEEQARQQADEKAKKILTVAIERYASEVTSERTVTTVSLPNDDVKGRIIGREGRNIREFERLSGVDLVIDDTPQAVTLSCFDPVRREVARIALTRLVSDGRIHPSRIEELLAKAQKEIDQQIRKAADEAAYELGLHNIRAEVLQVLGRLKYRTSFGQNVLAHSVEVARIGALIAAELGLNVAIVKRACLLHDIGKAIDHEVEGPHALVGADLIKRHGESPTVVTAVAAHHGEAEQNIESIIIQVADAISASRPGVRMESAEMYIKRLQSLEQIAAAPQGVQKAYAIQAGREVRVFVNHDKIDDKEAKGLAKQIAKQIETELSFPGQIKVTVIRETKFTEYAR